MRRHAERIEIHNVRSQDLSRHIHGRNRRVLSSATIGAMVVGIIGWIAAHFVANNLWLLESLSVLALLGTAGYAVLAFADSQHQRRPWILQAVGALALVWGVLLVGLIAAPFLKYPLALVTLMLVVLIVFAMSDRRNTMAPPDSERQAKRH
jgi:peptidoglycan/LPS O-acetylase OafA/YrhL